MADAADTASCGSYAIVRHARVTVTTGTCVAPGEVAHSLWMEVCVNYNCATTPDTACRRRHSQMSFVLAGLWEALAWHRATTSTT